MTHYMKTKKRSLRRSQNKRYKKRAERLLKRLWWHAPDFIPSDKDIGITSKTQKLCSCSMCCNERRRKKFTLHIVENDDEGRVHKINKKRTVSKKDILTKQELKSLKDFEDQLNELNERSVA